jgi:hypothetical protein
MQHRKPDPHVSLEEPPVDELRAETKTNSRSFHREDTKKYENNRSVVDALTWRGLKIPCHTFGNAATQSD